MWKNINVNRNLIKHETGKAVLIALPHSSGWDGYAFWHPSKLVRDGKHAGAVSLGYTDDFQFHLKKTDKHGKVLDEYDMNAEEFEEAFGICNENITAPQKKANEFETYKPATLEAVEVTALDELKDE